MIYFIFGSNNFQVSSERQRLIEDFIQKYGRHGVEIHDGENIEVRQLRSMLHAGSLFTPNRLIVINRPGEQKYLWEALGDELDGIPESTDLVIIEPAPDKRTRTYKQLIKSARSLEAKELDPSRLKAWVMEEAARLGSSIDSGSASFLVARSGTDQSRLHGEVKKLAVYDQIDEKLIESLVEPTPQYTVFQLLDAALSKNPRKTASLIDDLKATEDPYKTFGLLVSQVQAVALLVAANSSKIKPNQISADSGIHQFVITKSENLARNSGWKEIRVIIDTLGELDDRIKNSGSDPWMLLESALMRIANR